MKNKTKQNAPKQQANRARAAVTRRGLDAAGLAYAKLLADPCGAPMAHPTYSGTEGGYLIRCDSFFFAGGGTGITSGYVQFTPSLLSAGGGGVIAGSSATQASAVNPSFLGDTSLPGKAFLNANAAVARCVAACMKVSFTGTEAERSGRVHYGQTTSGQISAGTAYAPGDLMTALPHYERTPASTIELVWKPNDADQLFSAPLSAVADDTAKNNKCASLTVAWSGTPAGVGLHFHLTAVYEWQPKVGLGLGVPNLSKSPSQNTLDEVVNYLIARGETFIRSVAAGASHGAMAGIMAGAYGMMDPRPRARPGQRLLM